MSNSKIILNLWYDLYVIVSQWSSFIKLPSCKTFSGFGEKKRISVGHF